MSAALDRPVWAKLTAHVTNIAEIADAATSAGAEAVTITNTMLAMAIDPETRRPRLGAGGGGLSGPAIHPIAVRAVHDVHTALPNAVIVGWAGWPLGRTPSSCCWLGPVPSRWGRRLLRTLGLPCGCWTSFWSGADGTV